MTKILLYGGECELVDGKWRCPQAGRLAKLLNDNLRLLPLDSGAYIPNWEVAAVNRAVERFGATVLEPVELPVSQETPLPPELDKGPQVIY